MHTCTVPIRSTLLLAAGLLLLAGRAFAADAKLADSLFAIGQESSTGLSVDKVEEKALALLKDYKSPSDVGKVYAFLVRTIRARASSNEAMSDAVHLKVLDYCTKAARCPLDVRDGAVVYLYWSAELQRAGPKYGSAELPAYRRVAVMPALTGLRLLLDNGVPKDLPNTLPVVTGPVTRADPDYQDFIRENPKLIEKGPGFRKYAETHVADIIVRQRRARLSELVGLRSVLTNSIQAPYSWRPYATEELKALATAVLQDEKVVEELVAEVEKNVHRSPIIVPPAER